MSPVAVAIAGPSAHARHAAALAALGDDAAVLAAVGRGPGPWRRTYGRFTPEAAAFATLVFERDGDEDEIVAVEARVQRPELGATAPLPGTEDAAWLVARDFRADPRLPTMAAVIAGPGRRTVVRYRPGQRCTMRVHDGGATRYVKVHRRADVGALHADAVALWRASREGRLGFAVARPDRFDEWSHTVSHHAVVGEPIVARLLEDAGVALAERLGRALGTLTGCKVRPARAFDHSAPLARAHSAGHDLARRVPALAPAVAVVLERIAALHRAAGQRPARPIHGAPHPSQWMATAGDLALVDFDGFALGDPELDVAVLQAEIEDERAPADVAEAVAAGYEAVAGPLDPRLLTAYRASGRLATARRRARAVRADGAERAEQALAGAVAVLDGA